MHRAALPIFAICVLVITACTSLTRSTPPITAFQVYSGNGALPPEYQRITIIRGTIEPSQIALVYTFRDKNGQIERQLTLQGDQYQKYVAMVRQTRIAATPLAGQPIGGSVFDVTLTDAQGRQRMGTPSNREDWLAFAEAITQAVGTPAEVK